MYCLRRVRRWEFWGWHLPIALSWYRLWWWLRELSSSSCKGGSWGEVVACEEWLHTLNEEKSLKKQKRLLNCRSHPQHRSLADRKTWWDWLPPYTVSKWVRSFLVLSAQNWEARISRLCALNVFGDYVDWLFFLVEGRIGFISMQSSCRYRGALSQRQCQRASLQIVAARRTGPQGDFWTDNSLPLPFSGKNWLIWRLPKAGVWKGWPEVLCRTVPG